jgi:tetratricopeptide (TPR) repeat protein
LSESVPDADDARLSALLRTATADAPPPDVAVLAAIRARTAEAFAASNRTVPLVTTQETSTMALWPVRIVVACVAMTAGLLTWFSGGVTEPERVAWADLVRDVETAVTLHLQVVRDDRTADVYVRQPGQVRFEQSSVQYAIADGTSFWRIEDGDVTPAEPAPKWLTDAGRIDLLGLLDLSPSGPVREQFLRPAGDAEYAGRPCRVYSRTLADRELRIDVYTDRQSGQFVAVAAREPPAAATTPPVAEVRLIALNLQLNDEQFAVSNTLAERGLGVVSDVQGLVAVRPRLADRWTLVARETRLEPGDWVRAELRGAHAAKLSLASGYHLILGPGALVELTDANQARISSGEVQIERTAEATTPFTLLGPNQEQVAIADVGKTRHRIAADGTLQPLPTVPLWLAGFEGATTNESIGALIVNIDGRNEPLTVGEHHVTVDIRDQIARTTIEETFVNRTGARLEGQFHFPLPPEASISGFGMWIGNELVEADIVEKQRARDIYETILREKRDPGLLEWTGGNIFKARVFPIEPFSEKRIKITYTQVLPLRGSRYRYAYGLRSELLQKFPLRELFVQVNVHSALPLKRVASPSHVCRTQSTTHSARLEFTAREHTPTRDFEVVCEVDGSQSPVVVVPHRRGDDGYLLLQLTPPGPDTAWQRDVLPNGEPLDLLVLCDTSGSMDATMRQAQTEFVTALLTSLGPKDRFNVATADVATTWLFPEPMTNTAETLNALREKLTDRVSLGWSNFDAMAVEALGKASAKSHVIYVGDGMVTGVQSDPQEFVTRLGHLAAATKTPPTWHAVSVGNTSEAVVLRAFSQIGRGSVRQITGEQSPALVARELLSELTQPGLKDLNIEFRGVEVAAVYPEPLPNLPAGMQQILVGRYRPTGADQTGEVVITGRRGDETMRYVAKVSFRDAEEGNSFIPRLWARGHLDHLLNQGASPATQDEIIRLSETFHIITPYTSLLVLETDADRERFGVRKRYEMRDGEKFFADGKTNLRYDLAQQQMRQAEQWRLNLRRQLLAEWAKLGRDPNVFNPQSRRDYGRYAGSVGGVAGTSLGSAGRGPSGPWGGGGFGRLNLSQLGDAEVLSGMIDGDRDWFFRFDDPSLTVAYDVSGTDKRLKAEVDFDSFSEGLVLRGLSEVERASVAGERGSLIDFGADWKAISDRRGGVRRAEPGLFDGSMPMDELSLGLEVNSPMPQLMVTPRLIIAEEEGFLLQVGEPVAKEKQNLSFFSLGRGLMRPAPGVGWLSLFPTMSAPPADPVAPRPATWWSADVLDVVRPLANADRLRAVNGGWEVRRQSQRFDKAWQRTLAAPSELELAAPMAWLKRTSGQGSLTALEWCDATERGAYNGALQLARTRPATPADTTRFRSSLTVEPLEITYRQFVPTLIRPAADRAVIALRHRSQTYDSQRFTIDTVRHVIVQIEHLDLYGKVTSTEVRSDFVEVAGLWFPTKRTVQDAAGKVTNTTTQSVSRLDPAPFAARMTAEREPVRTAFVLAEPLPKLTAARQKLAAGQAGVADRMIVMLDATLRQQWDELFQQFSAVEQAHPDRPGLRWLRIGLERESGRNEEARQHLLAAAQLLVNDDTEDALARTHHVLGQAHSITGWHEFGTFVTTLRPVFARQADAAVALHSWKAHQANVLRYTGKTDESLALRKEIVAEVPGDVSEQVNYANVLVEFQQPDAALAWLTTAMASPLFESNSDQNELRSRAVRILRQQAKWADVVLFCEAWTVRVPDDSTPYAELLSGLLSANDIPRAERLVREWMTATHVARKLTPTEYARFEAALNFTVGEIPHLSSRQRLDPQWAGLLETTAKHFIAHAEHPDLAPRILGQYRFNSTDAADRVRGVMRQKLWADAATLPVSTVRGLVDPCLNSRCLMAIGPNEFRVETIPRDDWAALARVIRGRHDAETKPTVRRTWGDLLVSIYASRFADTDHVPFLRERLANSTKALAARDKDAAEPLEPDEGQYVAQDRQALFDALRNLAWTEDNERELFALLPEFRRGDDTPQGLFAAATRLSQLIDSLIAGRIAAATKAMTDQAESEKLTRTELQTRQQAIQTAARTGVADRLTAEAARFAADTDFSAWLRIERATLDVQLGRNIDGVLGECWELLSDPPPPKPADDVEWTPQQAATAVLRHVMQQRALVMVLHLAAKPQTAAELVPRVMSYLDAGIQRGGEPAAAWKRLKGQFLITLDRPEDIERELLVWLAADPQVVEFALMLARLRAERGDVPDAIARLEAISRGTPLSPADRQLLSNLYLAVNRRADHERLRRQSYEAIPEWQLSNFINQARSRLASHAAEVDERLLDQIHALFAKAGQPEQYLWQLRELYRSTRDFRLLRMTPDILLGRTRERQYGLLQSLDEQLLTELKEAAADELLARVRELRSGTDAALARLPAGDEAMAERAAKRLDRRALDLTIALVERRSSEVPDKGEPHATAAVIALRRAAEGGWQPGERLQFAAVLKTLRRCSQPAIAAEQVRLLRELVRQADPTSDEGLQLTSTLAHVLFWHYPNGPVVADGRQEALALQETAVRGVLAREQGRWPLRLRGVWGEYLGQLREAQRYTTAEALITSALSKAASVEEREWLDEWQLGIWTHALRHRGRVSLGEGEALFAALLKQTVGDIAKADDSYRHYRIGRTLSVFDAAFDRELPTAKAELRKFALVTVPPLMTPGMGNYHGSVSQIADRVGQRIDKRTELEFLIQMFEQYPPVYRYSWDDPWQQHGSRLARCRHEAGDIGPLTPRLLKLVTTELRSALLTQESRGTEIYRYGHQTYWAEQESAFVRVAEEVLVAESQSPRIIRQVAEYLAFGANRMSRGIEVLFIAHRRGLLDDDGVSTLAEWLTNTNRNGEAAPLLEGLVDRHPHELTYRTRLMIAYHRSQRPEQVRQTYERVRTDFQRDGRWTDDALATVGDACLATGLNDEARQLFTDAVTRRQRTSATRGMGDESLSRWYQQLARANANLQRTADAVDAAAAAIVCWPATHHRRTEALNTLRTVIEQCPDLDAYAATVDAQAKESGQDSPVIRQAIGEVHRRRKQWAAARRQFEAARELQPNNRDVNAALLACYDGLSDQPGAVRQLLAMLAVDRHNLDLLKQLVQRTKSDDTLSERAATQLIETGPNESEYQQALAEHRQTQNRWSDAIAHWERVADLRRTDPTGPLKLSAALIHERQVDRAKQTLRKILARDWPAQFPNAHAEATNLLRQVGE